MLIGVDKGMPLLSLACNASNHSIVAGTELVKPDAFVLFWYTSIPRYKTDSTEK